MARSKARTYGRKKAAWRAKKKRALVSTVRKVAYSIQETKYFTLDVANIGAAGVYNITPCSLLNSIGVGTSVSTRIGNKIYVKYIRMQVQAYGKPPVGSSGMNIRVVVAKAIGINNGTADQSQLIIPFTSSLESVTGQRNPLYLGKWQVYQDKLFPIMPVTTTLCGPFYNQDWFIPINEQFVFTGTPGATTTSSAMTEKDLIVFVMFSDANCCDVKYKVTVAFKDA